MDVLTRDLFGIASSPETWFTRAVAYLEGDTARMDNPVWYSMEEHEMSLLKNANAILATLHVAEAVTEAVADKHAQGEHFTVGDLAIAIAENAPGAVVEAGIANHVWKPAPPKRGGRRAAQDADK